MKKQINLITLPLPYDGKPRQSDGNSCGNYVDSYIYFILSQTPFVFIQDHEKIKKWTRYIIKHFECNKDIDLKVVEMNQAGFVRNWPAKCPKCQFRKGNKEFDWTD